MNEDESTSKIMEELDKINNTYEKYRPCSTCNSVFSPFDTRLRIQVDQQIMPTNIEELDKYMCGGLQKQTLTGFLTTTGGGKSTLLFTLTAELLNSGYNVAFINLEMNDFEVNSRIIAATLKSKPYQDILNNLTNDDFMCDLEEEWNNKIKGTYNLISSTSCDDPYIKYDAKWLENILLKTEEDISKQKGKEFKFDVIIIDYLFLMSPINRGNKNERSDQTLQRLTQDVHKMAQINKWSAVTVFQTNRSGEDNQEENKKLGFAQFGDSYAANRDMEFVFSFRRSKESGGIIIDCIKSRHYDGEKQPFTLKYEKDWMCYSNNEIITDCSEMGYKNNWRHIADLKYIQENLTLMDISRLCEKNGLPITNNGIKKYYQKKGISWLQGGKSKVDWKDINIDNLIRTKNGLKIDCDLDELNALFK